MEAMTMEAAVEEETHAAAESLVAENTDAQTTDPTAAEPARAKPAPKAYDSLDSVLRAMSEQDEQLRTMKTQLQEMIANSAALRKGIKQIVQDAQKNDSLEVELAQARRKLATMKNFLSTV
jgi:signal transduction histidine kinase